MPPPIKPSGIFQSTLSMRRATGSRQAVGRAHDISIHALHEESDTPFKSAKQRWLEFQSTLSMRRATPVEFWTPFASVISIHALHEESDLYADLRGRGILISIHALHEESDLSRKNY